MRHSNKIIVDILIAILTLACLLAKVPALNAQGEGLKMIISPEMLTLPVGANFTVTVNVTNVQRLYTWQVVLKFNDSVVNCTGVWIPSDNIFKGKTYAEGEHLFDRDYVDKYAFLIYGASLIGENYVDAENSILFKANFTVKENGATRITFATKEAPARRDYLTKFYSFTLDYDLDEITSFTTNFCTVVAEGSSVNLPPSALLTVIVPEVDTSKYVALKGYTPVGDIPHFFAYKGYPVIFNASASTDDGWITRYVWDFGDGNITETSMPIVVHVYNSTGRMLVTLTVFDNGDPPLNSTYRYIAVVGLLLERFDWSPLLYGLAAVFATAIVAQSFRKIRTKSSMSGRRA